MRFNPKEAWNSAKIIYVGEKSHQKHSTIMSMLLLYGNTAITDVENASVLGPHFSRIFCTDLPVDWYTLEEVRQRDVMQEIDQPISWDEIKAAVKKLTNI